MSDTEGVDVRSPFLPLFLVGVALLVWMLFQTTELVSERNHLRDAHAAQAKPIEQSEKLRGSLDHIAAGTQRLADSGNANAKLVISELKKRGISVNPDAKSSPPPG